MGSALVLPWNPATLGFCEFLNQCLNVPTQGLCTCCILCLECKPLESESVRCSVESDSATPWTVAFQVPLSVQWIVFHFLLQGIFLTQGSNLGLLLCRQFLSCCFCLIPSSFSLSSYPFSPSLISSGVFLSEELLLSLPVSPTPNTQMSSRTPAWKY